MPLKRLEILDMMDGQPDLKPLEDMKDLEVMR